MKKSVPFVYPYQQISSIIETPVCRQVRDQVVESVRTNLYSQFRSMSLDRVSNLVIDQIVDQLENKV